GDYFNVDADVMVMAIGTRANPLLTSTAEGLKLNRWGYIEALSDTGETSLPGVYAGGDIVTGTATVIEAMGTGKTAAAAINVYLNSGVSAL
ncbi:MAG: FAD-dependent oxidoreductase, partial [Actinobacteria bacterium]|nr:FAD-dependent oxidoreductase [Actinomycetota bacterium]